MNPGTHITVRGSIHGEVSIKKMLKGSRCSNLMETAYATAVSANFRTESRGAHSRFDFPDRDDENWLCHSLYLPESESMTRRSVNMEPKLRPAFPPKIRTY